MPTPMKNLWFTRANSFAAIGALIVTGAFLSACTPGKGGDNATNSVSASANPSTPGEGSETPSSTPTPTPTVSPKEYSQALAKNFKPLNDSLVAFKGAKALPALNTAAKRVVETARSASLALIPMIPPPTANAEHQQLISALTVLESDIGLMSSGVEYQSTCTASSALAGLGKRKARTLIPAAAKALRAKGIEPGLRLPVIPKEQTRRLSNGKYIKRAVRGGYGQLKIKNNSKTDTVVILAKGKKTSIKVYVKAGKSFTVRGVRVGSYRVVMLGGADWDSAAKRITRNCGFSQFDDPMKYTTNRTSTGIYYSVWSITVGPSKGGTARVSRVDPADLPD